MERVKKTPISKLVYASVFPGRIEIKTRKGPEEEAFLRLAKEFKLPIDVAIQFMEREKGIITLRGDDLSSYYFNGDKSLDDSLHKVYSSIDRIGNFISYKDNLNELTFSEIAYFEIMFTTIYKAYRARQGMLAKTIAAEDKKFNKFYTGDASITEKEASFARIQGIKEEINEQKKIEYALASLFQTLANVCSSKMALIVESNRHDPKTVISFLRESARLCLIDQNTLKSILLYYQDINNHKPINHDIDILAEHGYSLLKK